MLAEAVLVGTTFGVLCRILPDTGPNITLKLPPADWFGCTEPPLFRILPFKRIPAEFSVLSSQLTKLIHGRDLL